MHLMQIKDIDIDILQVHNKAFREYGYETAISLVLKDADLGRSRNLVRTYM